MAHQASTTRIPTEGLKLFKATIGLSTARGFNDQNPDRGIETRRSRRRHSQGLTASTTRIPTEGLKLRAAAIAAADTPGFNDQNPDRGIETTSG